MSRWAIVLAGGEGTRMQAMIEECFHLRYPKQYCSFCGTRSMLEHTVERASQVVPAERILTVVGKGHCRYFDEELLPGRVIEQPEARDTAAGVLLPASYIRAGDPEATVVILPSDHFIYPIDRFVKQLKFAFEIVESWPTEKMVLMGAVPDTPESDYGWIEPGEMVFELTLEDLSLRKVNSFHEKPDGEKATRLLDNGWLWNTLVTVTRMKTLWSLADAHIPEVSRPFKRFQQALLKAHHGRSTVEEVETCLHQIYRDLPKVNFSRDILERVSGECVVLPLQRVVWSDWGRPERVVETLERIGKLSNVSEPLFQFVYRNATTPDASFYESNQG